MGDLAVGLAVILVGLAAIVSALSIHLVVGHQLQEDAFTRLLVSSMRDKTPVARRRRIA